MLNALDPEIQFLLGTAIRAGALGVAIATFALPPRARTTIAPFTLFCGSFSAIFFLLSAILSASGYFISLPGMRGIIISLFYTGITILIVPVSYILYKFLRIQLRSTP